jgi:cytochrome P450 family 619
MVKLLWAFDFEKVVDGNGQVIEPDTNYATGWVEGMVTLRDDVPCKLVPRSQERVETILREFEEIERDVFAKYE